MRWGLLILLVGVAMLAVVPAGTSATAPDEPCAGTDGYVAKAYYPSGTPVTSDDSIYPASTLYLYVCEDGDVKQPQTDWQFDQSLVAGIRDATNRGESRYLLTVGSAEGAIELSEAITLVPDLPAPTPTVEQGYSMTVELADNSSHTLQFSTAADRQTFAEAYRAYETGADNLLQAADRVQTNSNASADDSAAQTALETIQTVNLMANETAVDTAAFQAARAGSATEARRVIAATDERTDTVQQEVEAAVESYMSAHQTQIANARQTIFLTLTVPLLIGGLAGGGVGYVLAQRKLKTVERARNASTSVSYSISDIALPLLLAAVALLVAVILLALRPAILGVIL